MHRIAVGLRKRQRVNQESLAGQYKDDGLYVPEVKI